MNNIIEDIQNKLIAEVPALKYIDQDWGQMDFYPNPPVKFPCALIDIQSAEYSDEGKLIQQGDAVIVIRLFDMKLSNSSNAAPQSQKENAKKIWTLLKDVNKALHGQYFLDNGKGRPMRKSMRRAKRNDGCYQTELYYSVHFTDNSCVPVYYETTAEAQITVTLL